VKADGGNEHAIEAIRAAPPRTRRPQLGRLGPNRRPGRLLRRRRGQPPGTVRPGGRRCTPRRRRHDDGGPGPANPALDSACSRGALGGTWRHATTSP